jgi:hypothetical protein
MDETQQKDDDFIMDEEEQVSPEGALNTLSVEELENQLNEALENEDYEMASKIRDEINKRQAN